MKKSSYATLLNLLVSCSLIIGCNSQPSQINDAEEKQEKKSQEVDELVITQEQASKALPKVTPLFLQKKDWLWQGSYYNNDTQLEPINPERYQVIFSPEGSLNIIADCNNANSTYSEANKRIVITQNYISTRAYCGDDSLDGKYLKDLMRVKFWLVNGDKLILELEGHSGRMEFKSNK